MVTSSQAQAVLLLTSHFSKSADSKSKPLTNKEWGRFAMWLRDNQLAPESLLTGDLSDKLKYWNDPKIPIERIKSLLNRGSALAIAMEKWSRVGLWVLLRRESDYPIRLRKLLGNDAPPLFFGCGNKQLLNQGGIAVVGSRDTSEEDLKYSKALGKLGANSGYSIVSGGARGVDEAAMLGALEAEGTAIGVLANDLLRASSSAKYRRHLQAGNLVLISPFHPEAGFNAGNAMRRNRYIYCLSDTAIAVHSGTKGGTWEGVLENIKHDWVPIWIKPTQDKNAGNSTLIRKGAQSLPDKLDDINLESLISNALSTAKAENGDMFSQVREPGVAEQPDPQEIEGARVDSNENENETETETETQIEKNIDSKSTESLDDSATDKTSAAQSNAEIDLAEIPLYEHFLALMLRHTSDSPKTVEELMETTELQKSQLNAWLKQAVTAKKLNKLTRPVRYQWAKTNQGEMFEDS